MPRTSHSAEAQFRDLDIPVTDWTPAMQLAVKQKWSSLPVDEKVADLRDRLAAVKPATVPSVADLKAQLILEGRDVVTDADAEAEHKRLKRNAAVNAWRERNQLQAALDARELRFAAMRAKRKPATDKGAGGDAPPLAAVS